MSKTVTIVREIKTSGNSQMVRLHKKDLDAIGVTAGSGVRVTLEPVSNAYDATRKAAQRTHRRYSRTLEILGK